MTDQRTHGTIQEDGSHAVQKVANLASYLEACLHAHITVLADDMFAKGIVGRDERIAISAAVGDALTAFNKTLKKAAPGLSERAPTLQELQAPVTNQQMRVIPSSASTIAPLDMPTLYPAVNKSADGTIEIAKFDDDQQLVFGWASVASEVDGHPVLDHQGDIIEPHELEGAAYQFMRDYADGGELHEGDANGKIVESVVFTRDKVAAMGLEHPMPIGWWIGMRVDDPVAFAKVKTGEYRMFSIQGRAVREQA